MNNMAITPKGLKMLLAGVLVMVAGYILMTGPAPVRETFNYDMFDWRRMIAAPLTIVCGIVVIVIAIMGGNSKGEDK